jgi:dTMP kinase
MLISISGVDGSGKTTYAEILRDTFIFCELRTKYMWSRIGSSALLKPFSKIAKILHGLKRGQLILKPSENTKELEARREELFGKSSLLRSSVLAIILAEMLCQYFFRVKLPLLFNKIVICDRYVYDSLVDISTRYGVDLNSKEGQFIKRILMALTPAPDISYCLFVPLENACSRKNVGEEHIRLIEEQISLYREIASVSRLKQIVADDHSSITGIGDTMIHESLTCFYNKWPSNK